MKLFDEFDREDHDIAEYTEREFAFLNRCAWPSVQRIRELLESWIEHFPKAHQADLLGRFRDKDDAQHQSAFFELFIHELLVKLGCEVEVHPETDNPKKTRPDFLAKSSRGEFYVEAVLATDESDEARAGRTRINVVYDVLNKMESPDFFVGIEVSGFPAEPPPGGVIRDFLTKHLDSQSYESVNNLLQRGGFRDLPHWRFEFKDWKIVFFPIPKSPELRGKPGVRPIGMVSDGLKWIDSRKAIKKAVSFKAGRYGELDLPYVIAVNCLAPHVEDIDIMEALFGKETFSVTMLENGKTITKPGRMPDGAFTSTRGPINTRVSAVLVGHPVIPWNIPRAPVCLYHNPYTSAALDPDLTQLPQRVPEEDFLEPREGKTVGDILGLRASWPED